MMLAVFFFFFNYEGDEISGCVIFSLVKIKRQDAKSSSSQKKRKMKSHEIEKETRMG